MSRYQITQHPWPISGQWTVPVGTIIDTGEAKDDFSKLAVGLPIPLNAMPLDQATYDEMVQAYSGGLPATQNANDAMRWVLTSSEIKR